MAASKGANTYNRQNWEDSSFPILCETCLGPSPFVRMMKEKYGKECKICDRPFTIFRWCPGPKARFKKTEVCQSCAKIKNVCQTCLFDLEYGLPVEVRDKALRLSQQLPKNDVNREYFHQQIEQSLEVEGDITAPYGGHQLIGKAISNTALASSSSGSGGTDLLLKLARTAPYYRRNRPHICSFWVKGECRRGEECPYRHEKPTDPDDPLSDQKLRDRYYGHDDPVAAKLLSKYDTMPKLTPPEDRTITTLYIGGIPDGMTEKISVIIFTSSHCAFIQFATRGAAERAAEKTYDRLILGGHRLTVNWGKSPAALAAAGSHSSTETGDISLPPVPGLPLPPVLPPTSLLTKAMAVGLSGNFFMAPPPPPPPPPPPTNKSSIDSASDRISGDRMPVIPPPIQIAPPVVEPPPPGELFMRNPPPPPLPQFMVRPTSLLQTPPPPPPTTHDSNSTTLLPMPPPPPPPPLGSKTNKTASSNEPKSGKSMPADGALGIHYPSQNPQRMGSVPHTEQHD
ncbi:unnamed protein product [Heterobilharzia americana]|nr:unnamed protein product [Heterobilharzia americana]